jgi:hypothetical protein
VGTPHRTLTHLDPLEHVLRRDITLEAMLGRQCACRTSVAEPSVNAYSRVAAAGQARAKQVLSFD